MQQLIENTVGSLESLSTNEKSTVVAAINEIKQGSDSFSKLVKERLSVIDKNLITASNDTYTSGKLKDILTLLDLTKNLTTFSVSNEVEGVPNGNGWYNILVFNKSYEYMMIAINTWEPYHMWFTSFHFSDDILYLGKWKRLIESEEIINENLLINPDFRFNQREVTELISNGSLQYICDRWYHYSNDNYSVAKYINDKIVLYSGRIGQVIENIKTGTYTITIKISSTDTVALVYKTGDILVGTIPAEAGEYSFVTILEDGNNFFIQANEPSTNGIVFEWIKLEKSSVATKFVSPDPAKELLKCQRYYEKGINNYSLPVDELIPNYIQGVNFKVNKRAIPTITITDYEGTQHCATDVQGTKYNVLNTFHNEYGIQDVVIDSATHNVNRSIYYRFIADAEYY